MENLCKDFSRLNPKERSILLLKLQEQNTELILREHEQNLPSKSNDKQEYIAEEIKYDNNPQSS